MPDGNIVIVYADPNGGNWADGINDHRLIAAVAAANCNHAVQTAMEEAHLAVFERLLTDAGFEPLRLAPWEVETEIARGALHRGDLAPAEEGDDGPIMGAWQQAWEEVDVPAIARRILAESAD